MRKKALGIGLGLLSVALWVGPIVIAFGSHGWDLNETVLPSEEQRNNIQNRVENLLGEDNFSEGELTITGGSIEGNNVTLNVEFSSPFGFPLTIENFHAKVSDEKEGIIFATVRIDREIKIEKRGTGNFTLSGKLTEEGRDYENLPRRMRLSEGVFQFRSSGIQVEISIEQAF